MKFNVEKEKSIISDYQFGLNTVEIARKWNTYNTSIRRVLLRYGITPRTTQEVLSRVKVNPFSLGNEKSEYFLGLLLTDGCIHHRKNSNSVDISLTLKDKEMVENFRDFVCPENSIYKRYYPRSKTYTFTISVKSKLVASWLESKGNFYNKSYECDIYTPLTPHILRGIFDGDGYWHTINSGQGLSWGVCGRSLPFILKIKNYLENKGIKTTLRKRDIPNRLLYYLEIYKTVDVLKVANLMYKEAHISLIRKYETWHLFEETLREKFSKFKEGVASPNPESSRSEKFTMEGAETIMRLLSYEYNMEKG